MENFLTIRIFVLAVGIVFFSLYCSNLGNADESVVDGYVPYTRKGVDNAQNGTVDEEGSHSNGTVDEEGSHSGAGVDPAEIVAKAVLCFNDRSIYSSCDESYRLTESGNIEVPHEYVDQYCSGPCLTETHLVLTCIENIMTNFEFYNKATINDIRDTIKAGCGSGTERGNFNVTEHIADETNSGAGHTCGKRILFGFGIMMAGQALSI
ncbi:hypothetical protein K2173_022286 [Erythroxylum novogranatense]|uniref:DUF7731 domain-containing protein n=1 Tax=Erythroxylum novogranatense TaxID=1862640 RepID=A0AAV8TH71_9ROSI|nr:hypothetical protein K2173_022286 [Erythroxylum novogranatense]